MLIGLHGQKGSGKDTTFSLIKELGKNQGFNFNRVSFADNLKILACKCLNGSGDPIEFCDSLKENSSIEVYSQPLDFAEEFDLETSLSGREFLQNLGRAARQLFGEDFWINQVFQRGVSYTETVVTDVRHNNEAKRIRELGGVVAYIDRGYRNDDPDTTEQMIDSSLIDYVINNTGSLSDLKEEVNKFFYEVMYESYGEYEIDDVNKKQLKLSSDEEW